MKQSEKGSILLEALLSVIIVAVSITLIIRAMTSSLRASVYSSGYTMTILLLENQLFRHLQKGSINDGENELGYLEKPLDHVNYVLKSDFADELGDQLNRVTLTATWNNGKRTNNITINTLLINPPDEI